MKYVPKTDKERENLQVLLAELKERFRLVALDTRKRPVGFIILVLPSFESDKMTYTAAYTRDRSECGAILREMGDRIDTELHALARRFEEAE